FQAEDGIRDFHVTGVQTCALPISARSRAGGTAGRTAVRARTRGASGRADARVAPGRAAEAGEPSVAGEVTRIQPTPAASLAAVRSEERRVGEERRRQRPRRGRDDM